jgi:hypothetical protein
LNTVVGVEPSHPVVHNVKAAALVELIMAKITAASVASASTTAPTLTRRFCLITLPGQDYTQLHETKCKPMSIVWKLFIQPTILYSIVYHSGRLAYSA